MKIALAGNPNSGKTTMFNVLTGKNEKVGNWAGVTVDRKEAAVKRQYRSTHEDLVAIDLPGAYSMSPFTSEERLTDTYVRESHPDAIVNVVDSTNLSRSLFFTTQLIELGIPLVVALNKTDANGKKGNVIDTKRLSKLLGCPVVETVSTDGEGITDLMAAVFSVVGTEPSIPFSIGIEDVCDPDVARRRDEARFSFVDTVIRSVEQRRVLTRDFSRQDAVDAYLTGKWLGLPIFAAVMFLVFWISQAGPGAWLGDLLAGGLEAVQSLVADALHSDSIWTSILVDGLIGGFIAIIGFLPLVMMMYFLIALLEDCGYMARATVVLDPIFKRVGLSGKSVIPFIIGTGCAVPGVMACRTIRDERERRTTAMIAPFMPCGAKLPVITLFAGAFFSDAWWVGPLMYFIGIGIILLCALLVNALSGYRPRRSFFIMELPEYKAPSVKKAAISMCSRGWSYVVKAGTVILVCNFAVHLMQNFRWDLSLAEHAEESILASVALPFAYLLAPVIGYVSWQLASAAITGFIAKENVVGTLAVSFGISNLIGAEGISVGSESISEIALALGTGSGAPMGAVAAMAFLLFNLFSPPCFAAMGAMRAEISERRWFFAGIGIQLSVGYVLGFLVNFFGTLFSPDARFFHLWCPIVGWGITLSIAGFFTYRILRQRHLDASKQSGSQQPCHCEVTR